MADIKFKGSNDVGALEAFTSRALYRSFAHSADLSTPSVNPTFVRSGVSVPYTKDFRFLEHLFYGRVDPAFSVVEVNPNYLETIGTDPTSRIKVLNFVKDAFSDFRHEYNKRAAMGNRKGENPAFADMVPKKGYENPTFTYRSYITKVYHDFVSIYLDEAKAAKITSFENFVDEYMIYLETRDSRMNSPVTKSAFLVGNRMSPLITGLCIEIDTKDHAVDSVKVEKFIEDPDFEFYSQLATKYGFLIDKNAPWRLVANISSPEMLEYAAHRAGSASTVDGVFIKFYKFCFLEELETLRDQFLQSYNTFVDSNPVSQKTYVKDGLITIEKVTRSPLTRTEFDLSYRTDYWFEQYIHIKNMETEYGYSKAEQRRIAKNAKDLYNKLDKYKSLSYINRKFKGYAHRAGSLFYETQKKAYADSGRGDADIMEEIGFAARKSTTVLY